MTDYNHAESLEITVVLREECHLFPEVEILQQRRAPGAGPERVLVVGDGDPLLRRQRRLAAARRLVGLAARANGHLGVVVAFGCACVVFRLGHSPVLTPGAESMGSRSDQSPQTMYQDPGGGTGRHAVAPLPLARASSS